MRWRKLRFWTAVSVLSLLVLFATWLMIGDLSALKPSVERWVSEATGRDFDIEGRFDLDLGRRSVLVANDIVLGNAAWADTLPMLSIGRVEVEIRTGSLFRGPVIVERLELTDTELYLAERSDGPPNWVFADSGERRNAGDPPGKHGLPAIVRDAFVQSLSVRLTGPYREAPVELTIDSLRQSLADDRFVTLTVNGSLGGRRLAAEARLGTWEALLDGADIEYDVDLAIDTLTVESDGRIDDIVEPVRPEIRFAARGPDIDDLTRILGLGDKGSGTIDIEGGIGPADDMLELRLGGNLGQTRVAATAQLPDLTSFDTVYADIRAEGPDFWRVVALAGIGGPPGLDDAAESPFGLTIDLERRDRMLTIRQGELDFAGAEIRFDATLPGFPALDDGHIDLEARGPDLAAFRALTALPPGVGGDFTVDMTLDVDTAGQELFTLDATTTLGHLNAAGEIEGGDTYHGTTVRYEFELPDAAAAADALALTGVALPTSPIVGQGSIVYEDRGLRLDTPLTVSLDDINARIGGLIVPADGLVGSRLTVAVNSDSAASLAALATPVGRTPELPLAAETQVDVGPNAVSLSDISGELGSARFSGEASVASTRGISLRFTLEGPALEELLTRQPDLAFRPGPFNLQVNVQRTDSTLVINEAILARPNGTARLELETALAADRPTLRFALTAEGKDVSALLGRVGSFEPLPAAYSVDARGRREGDLLAIDRFDVSVGEATASASGDLNLRDDVSSTRFGLALDIPDMAAIGRIGDRAFSSQPLALEAEIEGRDNSIEARTFRLRLADSTIDGLLRYEAGPIPNLDVEILADTVTFEPLLAPPDDERPPRAARGDGRMIPDVALPFGLLDDRKGSLRVGIGRFERGRLKLDDVNVDAVLGESVLEIRDLSFRAPSGFLRSAAVVSHVEETGRMDVELVADDLAFGLSEANADLARTADANLKLSGRGNDLRTLFANLGGAVLIDVRGGRVSKSPFMRALYGDLLNEIVVTINPFAQAEPVTPIECIVVPLDIEDGRISNKLPSFLATDKIQLSIRTAIDFADEGLDIGIRSRPKNVLSISAAELLNPYIKVVGTLAKPTLAVDEQGVLITGGAALATGGLSILARAAWDRLGRSADPCEAALREAKKELDGRLAALGPEPTDGSGVTDP